MLARTLAVALIFACAPAPMAHAHAGHQGERAVVESISPAVPGLEVRVVPGAVGKLVLTTTGATTATVLGARGQAVLRVGPHGVDANRAAPEWFQDNEPLGIAAVPRSASRSARARWVRVSARRSWEWFDHRLHPAGAAARRWSIPLDVGGARAVVRGRLDTVPGTLKLRLDGAHPAAGVAVAAVDGPTPSLRLRNHGRSAVTVLGADGEVFARIGPGGVEVNVRSPIWVPTAQHRNRDLLAAVIDPAARPDLVQISPVPELIWPDPRLLPRTPLPKTPGELVRWSVPVVASGTHGARVAIRGATLLATAGEPVPNAARPGVTSPAPEKVEGDDGGGAAAPILIAVTAAVLLAGAALVRRRR